MSRTLGPCPLVWAFALLSCSGAAGPPSTQGERAGGGVTRDEERDDLVGQLLADLAGSDEARLGTATTAATALDQLCRGPQEGAGYVPPRSAQTPEWRERCARAGRGVEPLIARVRAVEAARRERGPESANSAEEDAFVLQAVSALGNTLLGNPDHSGRDAAIETLHRLVETPELRQDLQINLEAIGFLGRLGDGRSGAAPSLPSAT